MMKGKIHGFFEDVGNLGEKKMELREVNLREEGRF